MVDFLKVLLAAPPEAWAAIVATLTALISIAGNVWQARNWMRERERLHERNSDNFEKVSDSISAVNSTMNAMLELVRNLAYRAPQRSQSET